jgi:hypothetical protein
VSTQSSEEAIKRILAFRDAYARFQSERASGRHEEAWQTQQQIIILPMTMAIGEYERQATGELPPNHHDYPIPAPLGVGSALARFLWRPKVLVGGLIAITAVAANLSQLGWYEPLRLWLSGFGIHIPPSGIH